MNSSWTDRRWHRFLAAGLALLLWGCAGTRGWEPAQLPTVGGLENLIAVHPMAISGSEPVGESGFEALVELGIRTVVSVDGAYPDAERARAHGLRIVHLPLRYDDVPDEHVRDLVHVLSRYPGPVYVHCYHGQHRAPAALAAALVALGELSPRDAFRYMERAGTSPRYEGLYGAVRRQRKLAVDGRGPARILPERATVGSHAEGMSRLARIEADLAILERASWDPVAEHPDLDSASEARALRELLEDLARTPYEGTSRADYERRLEESVEDARSLEEAVVRADDRAATRAFGRLQAGCKSCHEVHRDRK